ncbi:hypothetical protein [Halorussus sp. AFM4]|uniref:hypothetical protein n=1 Tax=Halorussus sp. AFM4 TaxID=3421651 RepID=UPI003EBD9BD9
MNPFIELYQNPVGFLTAVAYTLALLALVFVTLAACWRNAAVVKAQFDKQYPHKWQYFPPASWLLRVAAIPAVLAVDAWALSALIWLVF